jgi:hypothetical protein
MAPYHRRLFSERPCRAVQWGKRNFGGQRWDLTHLDPMTLMVPHTTVGAPAVKVRVQFGCHVFTETWRPGDPADHQMMDGRTPRCFCPDRFSHSQHLPALMQNAPASRVLFSPQERFVMPGNPPGITFPYAVFFKMRQGTKGEFDAILDVVSAHERPHLRPMKGKTFQWLAMHIASGQPMIWPKK